MRSSISIILIAVAGLSGCGSITRGTSEQVAINAQPVGTRIQTSNGFSCDTTCTVKVPRKDEFTVTASKEGYQTETVQVTTKLSGGGAAGVAGNVLLGGVIGIGVDTYNGAGLDHTPNPVNIVLEPNGAKQVPVDTSPVTTSKARRPQNVPTS